MKTLNQKKIKRLIELVVKKQLNEWGLDWEENGDEYDDSEDGYGIDGDSMHVSELKPGMKVVHSSWDLSTSDPLVVVKKNGKLMLKHPEYGLTDIDAGGEDEYGWIAV